MVIFSQGNERRVKNKHQQKYLDKVSITVSKPSIFKQGLLHFKIFKFRSLTLKSMFHQSSYHQTRNTQDQIY